MLKILNLTLKNETIEMKKIYSIYNDKVKISYKWKLVKSVG